jgi:hypothetical protein
MIIFAFSLTVNYFSCGNAGVSFSLQILSLYGSGIIVNAMIHVIRVEAIFKYFKISERKSLSV